MSKKYSMESFPSQLICNEFKSKFKVGEYKVAVYNGQGCPNTSLLGKQIVENVKCDFALIWTLNMEKKEYVVSLFPKPAN